MVPAGADLILVNGAEVPLDNPKEPDRHLHHKVMNAALDEVVAGLPNARVCDVRRFIVHPDDFTDHLRHYRRRNYLTMAEEIRSAGASTLEVQPESWVSAPLRPHLPVRRSAQARRGTPGRPGAGWWHLIGAQHDVWTTRALASAAHS